METPFCGDAPIAAGVLLGDGLADGRYELVTAVGPARLVVAVRDSVGTAQLTPVLALLQWPSIRRSHPRVRTPGHRSW